MHITQTTQIIQVYPEILRQLEILDFLAKLLQYACDAHTLLDDTAQVADSNTLLLHSITITESYLMIIWSLVVNGNTEWSTDGILTAITLTDGILRIAIVSVEVELQLVNNLMCQLWQTKLLIQWEYGTLHWSQCLWQAQYYTCLTILKLLLAVRVAHHAEEHTVYTD